LSSSINLPSEVARQLPPIGTNKPIVISYRIDRAEKAIEVFRHAEGCNDTSGPGGLYALDFGGK